MCRVAHFTLAALLALTLASCSGGSIHAQVNRNAAYLSSVPIAQLATDHKGEGSVNRQIHEAITRELTDRGFEVVDRGDDEFYLCEGIAVRYYDRKTWNFSMHSEVRIRFIDGSTGDIIATVSNERGSYHGYRDEAALIKDLFIQLDEEGFFKASAQ
jgi:hypothetical protein